MRGEAEGRDEPRLVGDVTCWATLAVFLLGLVLLAVRLRQVQVDEAAALGYEGQRQSVRLVRTAGGRGRILDRRGEVLADNRLCVSIVCDPAAFSRRRWTETAAAIREACERVGRATGLVPRLEEAAVLRHLRRSLAIPLTVWRDVGEDELARFCERAREFPGFSVAEAEERVYPRGRLAAHVLGFVGRAQVEDGGGGQRSNFRESELRGREGLESYYDDFLRGVPGERRLLVDARGFTRRWNTVTPASRGPDLRLTLDARIQAAAERALEGLRGACVVLDPRDGSVLAMASAPSYDLSDCVPTLSPDVFRRLREDPDRPLVNRAGSGRYAPGSTFKPVTALAGLGAGVDWARECTGVFSLGTMRLKCTRRWGHGLLDVRDALKVSCNPYFCGLGYDAGTNRLFAAARAFGLGSRTGLDLGADNRGVVPDDAWKRAHYGEPWRAGDLAQMSIGQGMLLVTPLQMALVAGAIGTGTRVRPHLKAGLSAEARPLPFPGRHLDVVREGMRRVVNEPDGSGRRAGEGLAVTVCGKTGTAEVGEGERRRKNTWFIAYAPAGNPTVALSMVVEDGESGGGTTAPLVRDVLAEVFGER